MLMMVHHLLHEVEYLPFFIYHNLFPTIHCISFINHSIPVYSFQSFMHVSFWYFSSIKHCVCWLNSFFLTSFFQLFFNFFQFFQKREEPILREFYQENFRKTFSPKFCVIQIPQINNTFIWWKKTTCNSTDKMLNILSVGKMLLLLDVLQKESLVVIILFVQDVTMNGVGIVKESIEILNPVIITVKWMIRMNQKDINLMKKQKQWEMNMRNTKNHSVDM